jgi:hypothetical protein
VLSGLLVLGVVLLEGVRYWRLSRVTELLFYAVVVRMWQELGPNEPLFFDHDFRYLGFLLMAVGGVTTAWLFRRGIEWVTGDIVAIQSLALAVIVARLYVNASNSSNPSLSTVLRYDQPIDRYLILVPALVAFSLPVLQRYLVFDVISVGTTQGFILVTALSLFAGGGLYARETGDIDVPAIT